MPTNDVKLDEIRKVLLSLLLARPGPTPITVLDRDYFEAEGQYVPCKQFGYADIVDFLKSMPEYFLVEFFNSRYHVRGIASEKTKHVSSLVSRQKNTTKAKHVAPLSHQYNRPCSFRFIPPHRRQRVKIPAEQLSQLVMYVKSNPKGVSLQHAKEILEKQLPHIGISVFDLREQLRELQHSLYLEYDMIYPQPVNDVAQEAMNHLQSSTVMKPRPSAMEYVGGDEGSDIEEDFLSDDDFALDYVSSNHLKQSKKKEELAASFTRNNEQNAMFNHNDDINVDEYFAASSRRDSQDFRLRSPTLNDLSTLISDRTKTRLDELIRKHPEGIWCAELPEKYLKEYNVQLNYQDIGFTSVREYVSLLPNIFYMKRKNSDDFLLYSADKRPTNPDQESPRSESVEIKSSSCEQYDEHNPMLILGNNDNAPIPADVSSTITKTFVPDDVMNYNDSVDQLLVTQLERAKKYLEVYVVELFNPSFFWIHLREYGPRIIKLMDDLNVFYDTNKDKYIIPKIALKKGLNCSCMYMQRWHRAIIRSVKADFKVTVFFYDYGTLKTYAPEEVYFLHKQFSFLPAQAIPCGLYNVKPCVGDRWKKSVTEQLSDKISDTLLALTIVSVDSLNNSMMVYLSDTSEEEDVHINEWLIKEKLAQYGKMGEAVDMASIMKYVVNHMNQLPTYCFAEESLTFDSCCKATSTEELHEVPLISKQTCNVEQHSVRPPPGFAPLNEKPSVSNMFDTRGFTEPTYPFANTSDVKASNYSNVDATTNPFSNNNQQFVNDNIIPNDLANQIFTSTWNMNIKLLIKLTELFRDVLGHSPLNRNIFENHMTIQYHLNNFLKNFVKILTPDNEQSIASTSSMSVNLARETTPDKVGLVEQTPINSTNTESFVNEKLVGVTNLSLSNPFDKDKSAQTHNMFPTYGSNSYTFTNQHQSDRFSPRVQVPSPVSTGPISGLSNYGSAATTANIFFPNTNQSNENSSATKLVSSPAIPMNTGVSNNNPNSSSFFSTVNEFAALKDTNPFKFFMINNAQITEQQSERMANNYATNSASCLPTKNLHELSLKMEAMNIYAGSNNITPTEHVNVSVAENYTPRVVYQTGPVMYNTQKKQTDADVNLSACNRHVKKDHSSKIETANIYAGNNGFTAAEQVNVNKVENYTSKIVYEAGPVMYNMQKKQTDADVKPNACTSDFQSNCIVSSKGHCDNKELLTQSGNNITKYSKHDSLPIDEGYVTLPPSDYTLPNSPSVISNEQNYHWQGGNANERVISSQTRKQLETPECWISSRFENSSPLQNYNETVISTLINVSSHKDWKCNKNEEAVTPGTSGMTKLNCIVQGNDKERPMDIYNKDFWNLSHIENQKSIEYKSANNEFFFDTSFVFQKIDLVKNATFVFHTEGEGWMLTHEFVEIFTKLKLCSRLINLLDQMNIKVAFKEIRRSDYPVQFLQLDSYPLNVPRDCNNRIVAIHLISLQAALSLLHKLRIVTREEIDNAFKRKEFVANSILPNMWILIVVYRDLKRRIDQSNKIWDIR